MNYEKGKKIYNTNLLFCLFAFATKFQLLKIILGIHNNSHIQTAQHCRNFEISSTLCMLFHTATMYKILNFLNVRYTRLMCFFITMYILSLVRCWEQIRNRGKKMRINSLLHFDVKLQNYFLKYYSCAVNRTSEECSKHVIAYVSWWFQAWLCCVRERE